MTLSEQKVNALEKYKETKALYLSNATKENRVKFCNAKRECMLLGVRV